MPLLLVLAWRFTSFLFPRLHGNACPSVSDRVSSAFTAVSLIVLQDRAVKLWLCVHPDRRCVCKQNCVGTQPRSSTRTVYAHFPLRWPRLYDLKSPALCRVCELICSGKAFMAPICFMSQRFMRWTLGPWNKGVWNFQEAGLSRRQGMWLLLHE